MLIQSVIGITIEKNIKEYPIELGTKLKKEPIAIFNDESILNSFL